MDSDRVPGRRYRLVLRGELGGPFGFLFEGMRMDRVAGTTVLTGRVIDQVHLHGLLQRTQELGLELISVQPADESSDEAERLQKHRSIDVARSATRGADDECADG